MEYVICQAEARGSLIVSEFTGVSATLTKAVKVNPWDLGVRSRVVFLVYDSLILPCTGRCTCD